MRVWWCIGMLAAAGTLFAATVTGTVAKQDGHGHTLEIVATTDVTGDGKAEAVRVAETKDAKGYTITVGAVTQRVPYPDTYLRLHSVDIIDLDSKTRTLVVGTAEASDTRYSFFTTDAAKIYPLATLGQRYDAPGNGIVYAESWTDGFWMKTERYVYRAASHTLACTPQPCYAVGKESKTTQAATLRRERDAKSPAVAELANGSVVTFVLWQDGWYLLQTKHHLLGWFPADAVTPERFPELTWGG